MRRCRIYIVLIVLLASTICSRGEGWTPEAWSFTNTWSSTNAIATNNMFAVHVHQVVTQESSTNYIPAQVLSVAFTGIMSSANGSWQFAGSDETNSITYTNDFYQSYHPFDYRFTNRSLEQTFSITSGVVVTTIQRSETGVVTQVGMDVDTLRDYEMYMAIDERQKVLAYTNFPAWNHKNNRQNIATVKAWLSSVCVNFIAPTASTSTASNQYDFTSVFDTPKTNGEYYTTLSHLLYTPSNLSLSCGAPANYLSITPYKHLTPVVTPFGDSVTSTVTIIQYPSDTNASPDSIRTNTVYLYNGSTTNVTGTNGQIVSVSVLMTNTLVGYTEDDYGYKNMTNIFAKLIILPVKDYPHSRFLYWGGLMSEVEARNTNYYPNYETLFSEKNLSAWNMSINYYTNIYPYAYSNSIYPFSPYKYFVGGVDQYDIINWNTNGLVFEASREIISPYNYEVSEYISCSPASNQQFGSEFSGLIWYTKIVQSMNSTTTYVGVENIGTPEIYSGYGSYNYSAYRGIIDSRLVTNATQSYTNYVSGKNIQINVTNAFSIIPWVYNMYYHDGENIISLMQYKINNGYACYAGDNCGYIWFEDRKTSMGSKISYDKYATKNYAVTNGFKYY